MTFQRKLLVGFSLMALPALLVGAEAIRSNALERRALGELGESMARTRTYAELETAMFDQTELVWRYLSGLDDTAREEFRLTGEVVGYWQNRWRSELRPEESALADGVAGIQRQIVVVADSVFRLADAGQRESAYRLAQRELKGRLQPMLTQTNREIYRRARESSVRGAYGRLEEILGAEGRSLIAIMAFALLAGFGASWLISRSLARPISELTRAMAAVGAGDLDHPIQATSRDEIGDLARALASLRAAAQLVRRHPASPSATEHLDAIIEEVDRLDRRITHLLSFSRPVPFRPVSESLPRLIEDLLPAVAQPMRERHVELAMSVPATLPQVRVDPMQLEQALLEIVSNALDAMPSGGRLGISAFASNGPAPGAVVVEVSDTGGGIPAQVLPSVCEPFFTTRPEGTGLGLAIAKRYLEQNGGILEIASRPGEGTTVRLRLPAEQLA